KTPAVRIF
ncbi:cyclic nucleotide-binding domain protein, partial [Vibrio parahaemolyticus EKP-028]